MGLTLDEQETIIRIGRMDDMAEICTTDSRYMNKLDKLCETSEDWKFIREESAEGKVIEKFYRCPARLVSLRSKIMKRELTEEQKKAGAEALRAWRESQNQNI